MSDALSRSDKQKDLSPPQRMFRRDAFIVTLVLLVVMVAWLIESVRKVDGLNNDMHVVATMVAKDLNPTLYLRDVNYSTDELYRFYTPLYRGLLGWLWQVTGQFELGLVWLTPFVLGTYLGGMFWLLRRVTQNTWLALGVTVASAGYYETMGQEIWGSGNSTLMLARTLFTATVPFLSLLILYVWENVPTWPRMIGLGLGLGLTANLHPPSGMHLTVAVIGLLVLLYGFRAGWFSFWLKLIGLIVATVAGVWPTLTNYVRGTSQTDLGQIDFTTLYSIVSEWYEMPFRPLEIKFRSLNLGLALPQLELMFWLGLVAGLAGLMAYFIAPGSKSRRWLWLIGGLLTVWYAFTLALFNLVIIFALVAFYVIYRFRTNDISDQDGVLLGWSALIVAQSFLGYYLIVKLWEYSELTSLTTLVGEQPRAARFIYLPIFLLAGLAARAIVNTLVQRWGLDQTKTTSLSVWIGLFVALTPGVSQAIANNLWPGLAGLVVLIGVVVELIWWSIIDPVRGFKGGLVLSAIGIILILFGPLAPLAAPYLHLPAVNLLDPIARAPDLRFTVDDQALYNWTKENTDPQALFFWCEFGPTTTLHFRLKAERGLTHHWRDLNQRTYNPGTLALYHQRYRQFEAACQDPFATLSAAQESGADFILVPSRMTTDFATESCFFNDRYAVFPVFPNSCPAS